MAIYNLGRIDGLSAYEVWLEQGNEGTEEEFLAEFNKVSISENVVQNTNSMWSTEPPKIEE